MCSQKASTSVYFVDDNFIGNRKAARDMLRIWCSGKRITAIRCCSLRGDAQHRQADRHSRTDARGAIPGMFVASRRRSRSARRHAQGAEQRGAHAQSIKTINDYGIEVTSGIILGLDTDSDDTEARLKDFIELSQFRC